MLFNFLMLKLFNVKVISRPIISFVLNKRRNLCGINENVAKRTSVSKKREDPLLDVIFTLLSKRHLNWF